MPTAKDEFDPHKHIVDKIISDEIKHRLIESAQSARLSLDIFVRDSCVSTYEYVLNELGNTEPSICGQLRIRRTFKPSRSIWCAEFRTYGQPAGIQFKGEIDTSDDKVTCVTKAIAVHNSKFEFENWW